MKTWLCAVALGLLGTVWVAAAVPALAQPARPAGVPEAGKSTRIDAILQRGSLKVGVTPTFPWLLRTKNATGDAYHGSSWTLAKAYAKALGVTLEPVQVSNETKIPILLAGGIDITISAISDNPSRHLVIDLVPYSTSSFCLFGLVSNPKLAKVPALDALDSPDLMFAAYAGTNQYAWIPTRFPHVKLRGVTGSGQAPIDELLSGRADIIVADSPQEPIFKGAHENLISFPTDCSKSDLNVTDVAHAITKNQPAFLEFLRGVEKTIDPRLKQEDSDNLKFAREHPNEM